VLKKLEDKAENVSATPEEAESIKEGTRIQSGILLLLTCLVTKLTRLM
jgi:hypothetical protein